MNNIDFKFQDFSPYFLQEGVFGATLNRENESPIFLRMELLTKDNFTSWKKFKEMNDWVANCHSRGVLSNLIRMAGESRYPNYETIKEVTGFTYQEYEAFTEKAVKLKSQNDKIANIIAHNCVGSNHMVTSFEQGKLRYIVYASKNPTFSIQDAYKHIISNPCNLKNYITAYSDILITMGTDFSENDYFHNRGISRNPYWVFEGKYAGLSILLHGFTGVVANTYFPEKIYAS
ncbi:MAG: hypothetical protein HWD61_11895 [Parachlamydiaceae bacterium]|nr:MAG: hypothetical protein HWD61_11895 [Parachlamydiaceae bacterium]